MDCPPSSVAPVSLSTLLNLSMQVLVLHPVCFSAPFVVTNGVKQACVLALTLFGIMVAAVLVHAFRQCGIYMQYCMDGGVLNL